MSGTLKDKIEKFKRSMIGNTYDYDKNSYQSYEGEEEYEDEGEEIHVAGFTRTNPRKTVYNNDIDHIKKHGATGTDNIISFNGYESSRAERNMSLKITHPCEVQEATYICEYLKTGKTCVVNLEGIDKNKAQRIADFLGGAAYAVNGEIHRISNEIFLIAPATVDISGDASEDLSQDGYGFLKTASSKYYR